MRKKIFMLFVCAVFTVLFFGGLSVSALAFSEDELQYSTGTYGELEYSILYGHLSISDCNEYASSVNIPTAINGLAVSEISSYAFKDCTNLQYNIYNNGKYLGNTNNPYLVLMETASDSITSFDIHANTKFIYSEAFKGCFDLANVSVPSGIIDIGDGAFDDCSKLQYNTYHNAKYLGNSSNPYVALVEAVSKSIASCTINSNTKLILHHAFAECKKLTNISIPTNVTKIEYGAFSDCEKLESVTIPDSISMIDDYVFYHTGLKSVSIPSSVKTIGHAAFSDCVSLKKVNLSLGTKYISSEAFGDCQSLMNIELPGSIRVISGYAFLRCKSIETVTIPSGVKRIDCYAFADCESLKNVVIKNGCEEIFCIAFRGCTSLTSVTIPHSVKRIDDEAFEDCPNLKTVYYTGTKVQWNNIDVHFTGKDTTIKMSQLKDSPLVKAKWVHLHTEKWVTESERTCTTDGVKYMSCTVCNESKIEIIVDKAWGHKFGEWKITAEPSYEMGGIEERVCSECGTSEWREIEKLPTVDTETNTDDVFATDTLYYDDTLESQQNGNGEDSSKPLESDNDSYVEEDDDYGISRAENEEDSRVMIIVCAVLAVAALGLGITLAIVLLKKGK